VTEWWLMAQKTKALQFGMRRYLVTIMRRIESGRLPATRAIYKVKL
jgi:hypothetical protein